MTLIRAVCTHEGRAKKNGETMRLPFRKTSVRKPDPDIRRAGVERLENRRLFAVSVVQTYPGYYEVMRNPKILDAGRGFRGTCFFVL